MAALFDTWKSETGEEMFSFSILTTEIPPKLAWMHTRIPVRWLNPLFVIDVEHIACR